MTVLEARIAAVEARQRMVRTLILWAFALGVAVNTFLGWLIAQPERVPAAPVHLSALEATGPTELCPGDTLNYTFTLAADVDAVVAVDGAVYRLSEPTGIAAWSETRRMILPAGATTTLQARWFVPTRYWDWATGAERIFQAGDYLRVLAVGTTTRNTAPEIRALAFTVREDCS